MQFHPSHDLIIQTTPIANPARQTQGAQSPTATATGTGQRVGSLGNVPSGSFTRTGVSASSGAARRGVPNLMLRRGGDGGEGSGMKGRMVGVVVVGLALGLGVLAV
jgi:hypothetical protein